MSQLTVLEICAGAGGQAIGLEKAGWLPQAVVDNDSHACSTLRKNRPSWNVIESDVAELDGREFVGVDLFAGGLPCPPFSRAGDQLGRHDERDLFPEAIRLIEASQPSAVMLENVRGFTDQVFDEYRRELFEKLRKLGFIPDGRLLSASDFGVPQLRPRYILVALRPQYANRFVWPEPTLEPRTVGQELYELMAEDGWLGAAEWAAKANAIAPTIVGGSKKHGGPDLGPTRARSAWSALGVDGTGLADKPPPPEHDPEKAPKLTTRMVARLQGFPDKWIITGGKTAAYRQIGNALPPAVACAVGTAIRDALTGVVGGEGNTSLSGCGQECPRRRAALGPQVLEAPYA